MAGRPSVRLIFYVRSTVTIVFENYSVGYAQWRNHPMDVMDVSTSVKNVAGGKIRPTKLAFLEGNQLNQRKYKSLLLLSVIFR